MGGLTGRSPVCVADVVKTRMPPGPVLIPIEPWDVPFPALVDEPKVAADRGTTQCGEDMSSTGRGGLLRSSWGLGGAQIGKVARSMWNPTLRVGLAFAVVVGTTIGSARIKNVNARHGQVNVRCSVRRGLRALGLTPRWYCV